MSGRLFHPAKPFLIDQRGGVSVMLVLMLIPMIAVLGMATEASSWFLMQRAAQNAADSAAIAAASNACDAGTACHTTDHTPSFVDEAASVATSYGFTDSVANATVATVKNPCPAPNATQTCYWVTITKVAPINLMRLVGFNGDAAIPGGGRGQTIDALAVASAKFDPATFCLLSLASGVAGITTKGNSGSPPPFTGCSLGANGNIDCNQAQGASSDWAGGTASGCSTVNHPNQPQISDPYSALAANIPANTCGTGKKSFPGTTLAANSTITLSATPTIYCGDVTLGGDVTIKGAGVIVIENGELNPNNHTLTSGIAAGVAAGVTIIFTGPTVAGVNATHTVDPVSGGALNIAAPTSGIWSGVAIYTDPSLTTGVDYTAHGAKSTGWNVTGLIYMPKSNVTFDGEVSKALNGHDCFALVDSTFQSNGGVRFTEHQSECAQAGLTPPKGGTAQRQALVR